MHYRGQKVENAFNLLFLKSIIFICHISIYTYTKILMDRCLYLEEEKMLMRTFNNVVEPKTNIFNIFVCLSVRLLSLISTDSIDFTSIFTIGF